MSSHLISKATHNVQTLLQEVFEHNSAQHKAVVVYDRLCTLSTLLSEAYKNAIADAHFIDFHAYEPQEVRAILEALEALDLVVLIQSTNFRLDAFRIRVELFKRKIKVIEHPHLSRMAESEAEHYVNALAYDKSYFRSVGQRLKSKIDTAQKGVVDTHGALLYYDAAFEPAKLNIGDYSCMQNIGGQFPIGEVFTESKELTALHGKVNIFVFGDTTYKVNKPEVPITLTIEKGQVVACENSTTEFDTILANIRRDEGGVVWVRELGFGLNRAFTKECLVADTGTYERMCGVHLSLGAKHGMYAKPGFKRGDGRYHVDVFADTKSVTLDDEVIFKDEAWCV